MWYYLPEWLKWFKGKPKPTPEEQSLSEMIKRRAEEQKSVIERSIDDVKIEDIKGAKVVEKDFFE